MLNSDMLNKTLAALLQTAADNGLVLNVVIDDTDWEIEIDDIANGDVFFAPPLEEE